MWQRIEYDVSIGQHLSVSVFGEDLLQKIGFDRIWQILNVFVELTSENTSFLYTSGESKKQILLFIDTLDKMLQLHMNKAWVNDQEYYINENIAINLFYNYKKTGSHSEGEELWLAFVTDVQKYYAQYHRQQPYEDKNDEDIHIASNKRYHRGTENAFTDKAYVEEDVRTIEATDAGIGLQSDDESSTSTAKTSNKKHIDVQKILNHNSDESDCLSSASSIDDEPVTSSAQSATKMPIDIQKFLDHNSAESDCLYTSASSIYDRHCNVSLTTSSFVDDDTSNSSGVGGSYETSDLSSSGSKNVAYKEELNIVAKHNGSDESSHSSSCYNDKLAHKEKLRIVATKGQQKQADRANRGRTFVKITRGDVVYVEELYKHKNVKLFCSIVDVKEEKYFLQCRFGRIKSGVARHRIELVRDYDDTLINKKIWSNSEITLEEALRLHFSSSISRRCMSNCAVSASCSCRKAGQNCSTRCQGGRGKNILCRLITES